MKRTTIAALAVTTALMMGGCANKVHEYTPSAENILILQSLKGSKIALGDFTDSGRNESTLMCRLSTPVGTASGETFAEYIRRAFKKELVIAGLFDPNAPVRLEMNLDDIYGSTMFGNAYWEFKVTLKSSNGKQIHKTVRYDYDSSYLATSACSEMQRSFVLAVQKLIHEIVSDPRFKDLVRP